MNSRTVASHFSLALSTQNRETPFNSAACHRSLQAPYRQRGKRAGNTQQKQHTTTHLCPRQAIGRPFASKALNRGRHRHNERRRSHGSKKTTPPQQGLRYVLDLSQPAETTESAIRKIEPPIQRPVPTFSNTNLPLQHDFRGAGQLLVNLVVTPKIEVPDTTAVGSPRPRRQSGDASEDKNRLVESRVAPGLPPD